MAESFSPVGDLAKDAFAGIVTSLCFLNKTTLLAGHGPWLKVYDISTNELLFSKEVLPNNRIHRIVLHPVGPSNNSTSRKLFVYGSKTIALVQVELGVSVDTVATFGPFCDWIMDVAWISSKGDETYDQLAIAYAHNFVEVYAMEEDTDDAAKLQLRLLDRVQCEIRCILYGARFHGATRATLKLASGTVFNKVHVWSIQERNAAGEGVVGRELVGHMGVIFGVRFNEAGTMLSSVSDDRTIHVWDLVDTQHKPQVIYGHESRVWDCQFVDNLLVSISEDATCRVWKNNLLSTAENDQSTENEDILDETRNCLACWEGHGGKNVWSCAVSPDHRVVATGGQDSAVRLWSLEAIHCNKIDDDKDLTILNLPDDTHDDTARSFAFVKNEKVLSCTHHGQFVRYDVNAAKKTQSVSPHLLFQDQDFFSYSSMHHSECGELIVCCTVRGALMFYSPSNQFASLKVSVQVQKIDSVDIHKSELHDGIFYVISFAQNEVYLHELDVSVPEKPEHRTLYTLMGPGERTTITCTELLEERGLLICGSRESAMLVYRVPELGAASNVSKHRLFPSIQVRRMHGKQNISSVKCKPVAEGDDDADGITLWTTGRDGCYAEHRLSMLDGAPHFYPVSLADMVTGVASRSESATRCNDLLLETVYRNKVTKGWLEGLVYVDNELLLLGFYRKNFFVYNETKRFEVISIACGGAHRRWHFHTKDAKLDHSIFGFIRNKVLCTYIRDGSTSQGPFQESMLQQDYHGREVRAIQFHETKDPEGCPLFLIATAGEDTMVRVHQYIPGQSRFTTHSVLRKHASVVKCVQWSDGIDTLLFTAGGKEQLRCWKLDVRKQAGTASLALNCLEWATCPMVGDKSTETRIMDLTSFVYNKIKGIHLLGAVYSDSMIRIFVFDELTRKFALVVDGTWHAKCILQMDHCLVQQDQGRDRLLFFTAATDGRVAVWDISSALFATLETMDVLVDPTHPSTKFTEPISHFSVHLSGVNALQVVHWDAQTLLVMTGGEDNAMAATLIDKTTFAVVSGPAHVPDAHASSLTGLHVLHTPTSTDHSVLAATTSIDQRLNLWKVAQCGSDLQITLINAAFVDVPDPSALHGLQHGDETYLAATGIGLQAFKYHPPSSST